MLKKYRVILLLLVTLSLSGCFIVYRPPATQGNVITYKQVQQIHIGMSQLQVTNILGNPVLVNVFKNQQMVYAYTLKPSHSSLQKQQLIIYFDHGRVIRYTSNVTPALAKKAKK